MSQDEAVSERGSSSRLWRGLDSLLAIGSAIAWGAIAVGLWELIQRERIRRQRHRISNRLLAQVFPIHRR